MIIFPFFIPALVFTLLVAMMIKERNAFIPKTDRHELAKKQSNFKESDQKENKQDENQNPNINYWDLSGGTFGI